MKLLQGTALVALLAVHPAAARFMEHDGSEPERLLLIETSPGETQWVTEDEKWALRRAGQHFMDITDAQTLGTSEHAQQSWRRKPAVFPTKLAKTTEVNEMLDRLDKTHLQADLERFTSFHTRYYKSDYGRQSSKWLHKRVEEATSDADADAVVVASFEHPWPQSSLITTIPGKTNRTIVIGAHQDSINLWLPSVLAAPGADDDGSGTVTILEALRVLLGREDIANGEALNTIEFHWYSAEEGGLLGSQAIFQQYEADRRDVRAMLQQDMTGFVQRTLDAGLPESVGVITDYVDPQLTAFVKMIIEEYCNISWVETKCGYACSDHASASKAGYPSSFVIESSFEFDDPHVHSTEDLIKYLSFDHMMEHARMTVAMAYELAYADFDKLEQEQQTGNDGLDDL